MKYIIISLVLLLISCQQDTINKNKSEEIISSGSITNSIKCENCGVNLIKYISTNHIVQLKNKETKYYCSLYCLSKDWDKLKEDVENSYVIDVQTKEFFPTENAHYVIRDEYGNRNKYTAFAYKNLEYANRFKKDFRGKEIVNFNDALKLTKEAIANNSL